MIERLYRMRKGSSFYSNKQDSDHIRKEDVKRGIIFTVNQAVQLFPHIFKVFRFLLMEKIDIVYTSQFRSQLVIGWLAKLAGKAGNMAYPRRRKIKQCFRKGSCCNCR